ncbi:multidrug effflux MFS transporter [Breoghania sp. L-A4]|uniref:multidrug effflux MFS transporter n=1 Tax=Breoghania sp. L-A4 TaxID=2304600 RepID=UPI000E35AE5E|nr:multidrug effflux MFS transporter [Breoghania sp. L-A4]AXS38838.1 Bcr/CflA family efflux MFS transporter [Breoghania sp. L-A4]
MTGILTPLMSHRRTSIIGAALVAIGPITMALYTPAMPVLADVFGTSVSMIKLTLTAYFLGFAVTQLVCGPLSDAFGRRPVTLAFLTLYLIASALAAFAPTIEWMLAARGLQGVGAAVGIAVSRAIVRDQYTGQTSARIMNTIAMMLALGPALSPTIGGLTLELFGWREIFLFMILYGVVLAAAVIFWLPETNVHIDRGRIRPSRLITNYTIVLQDPRFLRPTLLVGCTLGSIYSMATIIPFVIIDHVGLSPAQFGFGMMIQSASFITGTIVTARLLAKLDAQRLMPIGVAGMLLAACATAVLLGGWEPTFLSVMGPIGMFAFSLALVLPFCTTSALESFPTMAGAASALMGFIQFGGGFLGSMAAAAVGNPVLAMATVIPAMQVLGVAIYFGLGVKARRAAAAAALVR